MTSINGDLFERRLAGRLFLFPNTSCDVALPALQFAALSKLLGIAFLILGLLSLLTVPAFSTPQSNLNPTFSATYTENPESFGAEDGDDLLAQSIVLSQRFTGSRDSLLSIVREQTNMVVAYSSRIIQRSDVSMSAGQHTVGECLRVAFSRFDVEFVQSANKIVVTPKSNEFGHISGFCRDAQTHEPLIGAHVVDTTLHRAAVTNEYGFFSLALPTGRPVLRLSYVGYQPRVMMVNFGADTTLNVGLQPNLLLEAVEVKATDEVLNEVASGSYTEIPMDQVRALPTLLGEADLTRALQQTPGVQTANEGYGGMNVRGGSQDQNMVYLDDAPLYNANHMLGFFSVFNSDAVSASRLIKSGFPARYGGRMASVLDIRTIDGNRDHFEGSANVGILASSVMMQGPLGKRKLADENGQGRGAVVVSARRTYFDLYSNLMQQDEEDRYSYLFYDFHTKANWDLNRGAHLYFTAFYSKDKLTNYSNLDDIEIDYGTEVRRVTDSDRNRISWGTFLTSLRWNKMMGQHTFVNSTVWFSRYNFKNTATMRTESNGPMNLTQEVSNEYGNGIFDTGARVDLHTSPSKSALAQVRTGVLYGFRCYQPLLSLVKPEAMDTNTYQQLTRRVELNRHEWHGYVEGRLRFGPVLSTVGLHLSVYGRHGLKPDIWPEPRVLLAWRPVRALTIKSSYSLTSQPVYLMRMLSVASPADMWLPIPSDMRAQLTNQWTAEVKWRIVPGLTFDVEAYIKETPQQVTYKTMSVYEIISTDDWNSLCTSGRGRAKGLEMFLHKKNGKLTGWLGYSLSESRNRFGDVNNGEWFPSDNDRKQTFQIFATYKVSKRVDVSASWNYGSGAPLTLPDQRYTLPGTGGSFAVPAQRNALRMPNTHQLNLGMDIRYGQERRGSVLSFGIYNVYGKKNPLFVYWKSNGTSYDLKQFTLVAFPWPYVKYSIHF